MSCKILSMATPVEATITKTMITVINKIELRTKPIIAHTLPAFKLLYEPGVYNEGLTSYIFFALLAIDNEMMLNTNPGIPIKK